MNIAGIIAEYNPFHRGHEYHIAQTRLRTGAEGVVVVLSGDFVQRGEPAVVGKFARARMALAGGADVVLELPVRAATASGEGFAAGGVEILDRLGVISSLSFGCEASPGEQELLPEIAAILLDEPASFRDRMHREMSAGRTWPQARSAAMEELLPGSAAVLAQPNNTLAVEYCKALQRRRSGIRPVAVPRLGQGYHSTEIPGDLFASASAIRHRLPETSPEDTLLAEQLPEESRKLLRDPVFPDDISLLLRHALLRETRESLCAFRDMSLELASRILSLRDTPMTFSALAEAVKTRNVTRTRVNRALLHVLLQIKEGPGDSPAPLPAVRLLGFRRGTPILHEIREHTSIPVVSKMADADPAWFAEDHYASEIYRTILWQKTGQIRPDDIRSGPVIGDGSVEHRTVPCCTIW